MKKLFFLIAAFFLIAVALWFLFFRQTKEARIKQAIFEANYCATTADCQVMQSRCPFECYVAVNKREASRVEQLIKNYQSTCIYGCVELKGVMCEQNKCVLKW